ncbi:sodium-independent anion transporter, partial [Escherichia coli]|nr:sodium-independent anion transporter [Escherichia coli]
TSDLSIGVLVGVVLSVLHFGWKQAKIRVQSSEEQGRRVYRVHGPFFFGSSSRFVDEFNAEADPDEITIDFSGSHIWDNTAVVAIGKVKFKYAKLGKTVHLRGLNEESSRLLEKSGFALPQGH